MNVQNKVIFKGTRNGVSILFDADTPFEQLCEQLTQKVEEAGKFFDGVKTPLIFTGREFTEEEEKKLLEIITSKTTMHITFLRTSDDTVKNLSDLITQDMKDFNFTKYHRGSLRNGQVLEFDGSIVILGDVNAGAQVRATGNIIVLGQLRGIAHAGCKGMKEAFVAAAYMAPVQLRIADIITRFPEENKHGQKMAEYAFVQDGQIFVMSLA